MFATPFRSLLSTPRRVLASAAFVTVAGLAASAMATSPVSADRWWQATAAQPSPGMLEPFDATGLPAGPARGIPSRATLPPGFNLKHVHGGPSYVLVLEGSVDIIHHADGTTATYRAGDFFWEPVGRLHTAQSAGGAELFILRFLTPGAEGTIPAS